MPKTTQEAKELWCPFAVASDPKFQPSNRTHSGLTVAACRCVADKCMMWESEGTKKDRVDGEWVDVEVGDCALKN